MSEGVDTYDGDYKTFGVFRHSRDGSYVVRTMWNGKAASPYSDQTPLGTSVNEEVAQLIADNLNAAPPECEGHPAGPHDPMGETVYCDGTCRP